MSVATISKVFGLSPVEERSLRGVYDAKKGKLNSLATAANECKGQPGLQAELRRALLAELSTIQQPTAQPTAQQPSTIPAPPPVPQLSRQILYVCLDGKTGIPYSPAMTIPPGSLVNYAGSDQWETYAPQLPTVPQVSTQLPTAQPATAEARMNYPQNGIPVAPSGKGKLPWIVSAKRDAKTGKIYATYGIATNTAFMKCSVPADELLMSLSEDNIAAQRNWLLSAMAQLQG